MFCERVGADVARCARASGRDRRIGPAFLFPGPGYGGSCFPKDVKALIRTARRAWAWRSDLLEAVEAVNERQKQVLFEKLQRARRRAQRARRWRSGGWPSRPETDDMRESPSIPLIEALLGAGAAGSRPTIPRPWRRPAPSSATGSRTPHDPYDALDGADALVIVTEWLVYRNPDFDRLEGAAPAAHRRRAEPLTIRTGWRGLGSTTTASDAGVSA